ncbi:MAG: hydroxyacylglutathione hydrolase [Alphaproteobacteria bacterium]
MARLEIEPVPCLIDNYAYLVYERGGPFCAVVDPSEAAPLQRALAARGLKLTHILNTHHHHDHVGGNPVLKQESGAQIVAAEKDRARIPGLDVGLREGDVFRLGACEARIIEIPAHTSAHIAYWFVDDGAVFTGDTLFLMGCGRLFEGTPEMMCTSLAKLAALPAETRVFCGHEYTLNNGHFAQTVEPNNTALQARMKKESETRARGQPTVPGKIGEELATNPFLRTHSPEIRKALGMDKASDVDVFAELRRRKDVF